MEMDGWNITSIGSICYSKWQVCYKIAPIERYVGFPLDNVANYSIYQFENLRWLLNEDFSQIKLDDLEIYNRISGRRMDTGEFKEYHGYKYVGPELKKDILLSHFFDAAAGNCNDYISFEDGWSRWNHKVSSFMGKLSDPSCKLMMVSIRMQEDSRLDRDYLAVSGKRLCDFMSERFGRSPENTRMFSIIVTAGVNEDVIDESSGMFMQIAMPDEPEEKDMLFWQRKVMDRYAKSLKKVIDSL